MFIFTFIKNNLHSFQSKIILKIVLNYHEIVPVSKKPTKQIDYYHSVCGLHLLEQQFTTSKS